MSKTRARLGPRTAELHRLYPFATGATSGDEVDLQVRATLAEARLADLRATLDDMRAQRDRWQAMAERLILTNQRPGRPWWRRLTG